MKKSFLRLPEDMAPQARNAILIATLISVAHFVAALYYLYLGQTTGTAQFNMLAVISLVLGVLFVIGAVLGRRGRPTQGFILVLGALAVSYPPIATLVAGLGLVLGIALIFVGPISATQVLPRRPMRVMAFLTGVSGLVTLLVDVFGSSARPSLPGIIIQLLATAVIILLAYFVIRQFRNFSLRTKLLVAFIGLTVIATGALGIFVGFTTNNSLYNSLERELSALTVDRGTRIGSLFNDQVNALTTLSLNEVLLQSVKIRNMSYEDDPTAIQASLDAKDAQWRIADAAGNNEDPLVRQRLDNAVSRELTKYQAAFPDNVEVFVTDVYGGLVGSTNRTSDYYQADEGWWQAAYNDGQGGVYIGKPEFDESASAIGSQIALPLLDGQSGEIIGILRTTFIVSRLATILGEKIGQTDELDLMIPGEVVSRIDYTGAYESIEPEELEELQVVFEQGLVEMEYEGEPSIVALAPVQTLEGNPAVDNLGWVVVFSQHQDEATAPIGAQMRGVLIVIIVVIALAAAAAFAFSLVLVRPIQQLTATAEEVSEGNLDRRAVITTSDEIGTLAAAFNTMTSRLQDILQGLEQRVAERTRNLVLAVEVGRTVSQVRELGIMLRDACERILQEFDLYYVQVYLTDPGSTTLRLNAGTGEVGAELLERSHNLPLNTNSINGRAAMEKRTVVIADTTKNATFRPNPLLPDTRSEMAVPLIVADKVVGVLDMQARHPGTLNEEMLPAFEALAGQLAVAIQNTTLLVEAQQARAEVEAQARRLARAGWSEYLDAIHKPESIGYLFDRNEITELDATDATELPEAEQAVSAPIAVSGEALGSLVVEVEDETKREITTELVGIVARQVAQQIENLRLLESAERYRFEAEQAARRQIREGWQDYINTKTSESLGYLYDLNEVRQYKNGHETNESAFTLPLKVRDEAIGKLAVQGLAPNDEEAIELANAVAERLSAHIESLRQYSQTQSALAQSEKLFDASRRLTQAIDLQELVAAAVTTLDIPVVNRAVLTTFDYDPAGNIEQLTIVANWWNGQGHEVTPIGTRYPLEVIRVMSMFVSPTPVFFNDAFKDERVDSVTLELVKRQNLRAVAVLPLHVGSHQIGALILEAEEPHDFTQDQIRLYTALAPQVATVLENRQQYERAQRQAEREAMLNAINQKIQSATSVEAVLQIAARELGHALGAPMTIAQLSMRDQN